MTTHNIAITYEPKIQGVRDGTIRQTIRLLNPNRPKKVGDTLYLFEWAGQPYRSKWLWKRKEIVKGISELQVDDECWVYWDEEDTASPEHLASAVHVWEWEHFRIDEIAQRDGIDPPTGIELKAVLEKFHGSFTGEWRHFQIIRW